MSSNRNKNTMCNVCVKVMCDDLLKRHMNSKHSNIGSTQHHWGVRQPIADLVIDNQYNDEVKVEDSEIEELSYTPLTHDAKLEIELQRDNEVYKKNVEIGEQISIIYCTVGLFSKILIQSKTSFV